MRQIRKTIYDDDGLPNNLMEAIAWLQEKLDSIPHDMREKAEIRVCSYGDGYDGASHSIEIEGVRDETQQEIAQRMLQEEQSKRTQALFREAQERAAYEALKRKFG